jgi:hypothetical protein
MHHIYHMHGHMHACCVIMERRWTQSPISSQVALHVSCQYNSWPKRTTTQNKCRCSRCLRMHVYQSCMMSLPYFPTSQNTGFSRWRAGEASSLEWIFIWSGHAFPPLASPCRITSVLFETMVMSSNLQTVCRLAPTLHAYINHDENLKREARLQT